MKTKHNLKPASPHRRWIAGSMIALAVLLLGAGSQPVTAAPPDAASSQGRLSLDTGKKVVYYRTSPLKDKNTKVKTAIIVVHGLSRNADDYFDRVVAAAELSNDLDDTIVLAPLFQTQKDNPKSDEHVWAGGWSRGDLSQDSPRVSSFAVVDHIIAKLGKDGQFPKLKRIVLAGHSAGGQFVNRYAAAGKAKAPKGVQVRHLVMNPSSYLYLKNDVDYKYGLQDLNSYASEVAQRNVEKTWFAVASSI